jgi:organic hydroperoxide reductase OsmC/OhrA
VTITDSPVDNGVNVQALLGAREALSGAPQAAEFTWRASCTWRTGTHSHSAVAGFTGLGAEHQHRNTYEYDIDHPECFASQDNGATPVEIVLVGLAGCLTAGVASVAQFRDIQLRSVTATIEGQMNILGILGAGELRRREVTGPGEVIDLVVAFGQQARCVQPPEDVAAAVGTGQPDVFADRQGHRPPRPVDLAGELDAGS